MPKLALKIDVDTYRGTREGVPKLVELLKKNGAGATFHGHRRCYSTSWRAAATSPR